MIELLKLCGFKEPEIEAELPRVEKVFNKLGITAEDVAQGKQRLIKYYDIELEGIRKALRLHMKALISLVLAREEGKSKIIYGFMTPAFDQICAALESKSKDVYAARPSDLFQLVFGCIFNKMVPILEAAEGKWLKSGKVAHCGNVKTILGLIALDLIPRPDLLVSAGLICETAPKTINLLQEFYDIPAIYLDTCLDEGFNEEQNQKRIADLLSKSLRKLTDRVQNLTGCEITEDMLRDTLNARGALESIISKIRTLIEESDPLPLSATNDNIWGGLTSINIDNIQAAIDALNTLYVELKERSEKGIGVVKKGAPRILAYTPTHYTNPEPEYVMTQLGIATVGSFFGLRATGTTRRSTSKKVVKDPYESMSEDIQHIFLPLTIKRRILMYEDGCKTLKVNGVLNRFHVGCRNIAGDTVIIQKELTNLGIPVLMLEWEDFDPRVYHEEQFKKSMELFKTILEKSKTPIKTN